MTKREWKKIQLDQLSKKSRKFLYIIISEILGKDRSKIDFINYLLVCSLYGIFVYVFIFFCIFLDITSKSKSDPAAKRDANEEKGVDGDKKEATETVEDNSSEYEDCEEVFYLVWKSSCLSIT